MGKGTRGLQERTFKLPERCSAKEFVMREIDGHDEKDIGAWIDLAIAANPIIAGSKDKLQEAENRESIRRSLVSVDGVEVNLNGVPYSGLEGWNRRTMNFAAIAFRTMNGVEAGEVGEFLAVVEKTKAPQPTTAESRKATSGAQSAA